LIVGKWLLKLQNHCNPQIRHGIGEQLIEEKTTKKSRAAKKIFGSPASGLIRQMVNALF
jgi:hypothetical protein